MDEKKRKKYIQQKIIAITEEVINNAFAKIKIIVSGDKNAKILCDCLDVASKEKINAIRVKPLPRNFQQGGIVVKPKNNEKILPDHINISKDFIIKNIGNG